MTDYLEFHNWKTWSKSSTTWRKTIISFDISNHEIYRCFLIILSAIRSRRTRPNFVFFSQPVPIESAGQKRVFRNDFYVFPGLMRVWCKMHIRCIRVKYKCNDQSFCFLCLSRVCGAIVKRKNKTRYRYDAIRARNVLYYDHRNTIIIIIATNKNQNAYVIGNLQIYRVGRNKIFSPENYT